jgi:hypothetical protein
VKRHFAFGRDVARKRHKDNAIFRSHISLKTGLSPFAFVAEMMC